MSKIKVNSIVNRNDTGGPTFLFGATVPSGQVFSAQGNMSVSGIMTATTFVGDGSALTQLSVIGASKTIALKMVLDPLPFRA